MQMHSTAESYFAAAAEHLASARDLHDQGRYYLAHFLAGLSVECMLRAYLRRVTSQFDAWHDLPELASEGRFFDLVPVRMAESLSADLAALNTRWRSNHRYFPESEVWKYLARLRADSGSKGDRHKNHSRTALNIALQIVKLGNTRW